MTLYRALHTLGGMSETELALALAGIDEPTDLDASIASALAAGDLSGAADGFEYVVREGDVDFEVWS